MDTAAKRPFVAGQGRGSTALGAVDPERPSPPRRRHSLGDAVRAVRVFAGTAFDVVVLGEYQGRSGHRNDGPEGRRAGGGERRPGNDREGRPVHRTQRRAPRG